MPTEEKSGIHRMPWPAGSQGAIIYGGCTCPVIDNNHGRGYRDQKGVYIYKKSCPLHGYRVGEPT